jgi:hypothetical protein
MAGRVRHDHGVLLGVIDTSHAITAGRWGLDPKGLFSSPEQGKRSMLGRVRGTAPSPARRAWLVFSPHVGISSPNRLTHAHNRQTLLPDALQATHFRYHHHNPEVNKCKQQPH